MSLLAATLACSRTSEDEPPIGSPAPARSLESANASATHDPIILGYSGVTYPTSEISTLLTLYPHVVVGEVTDVLYPFDPRPGFLGISDEELEALQSGPKGTTIPADALERPPANMSTIYSVRVLQAVAGGELAVDSQFALIQPGGVFDGSTYQNEGDPVVGVGSTYVFFLKSFDVQSHNFQIPADSGLQPDQAFYISSAEARLSFTEGVTHAESDVWVELCAGCETLSLLGVTLDQAVAQIRAAGEGRTEATPPATIAASGASD